MEEEVSPEMQEVTPGSPEHDALMAEKFDEQLGSQETPAGERPEWLPEKFSTPEDFAKAYAELERKQSQAPAPKAGEETPAEGDMENARGTVEGLGLDFDALSAEFEANEGLTEDSYKALEAKGLTRDVVDDFIEGQKAVATLYRTEALAGVGGEDAFADMVEWAAAGGLSPDEIAAFNEQVDSRNLTKAKMAIAGLKARFDADMGTDPELLGGEGGTGAGDAFRSTAELTAAMRDPRYKKDPAYREDVKAKLARSDIY